MTLDPILAAPPIIQIHVAAATFALLLGPVNLYRRRRDALHRGVGYLWLAAVAVLALSSFGIRGFAVIGPFGPLHLLTLYLLWGAWSGTRDAIAGRIESHRATFQALYWNGLILAGAAALLPGRRINRALFPETPEAGYALIVMLLSAVALRALRARRRTVVR